MSAISDCDSIKRHSPALKGGYVLKNHGALLLNNSPADARPIPTKAVKRTKTAKATYHFQSASNLMAAS